MSSVTRTRVEPWDHVVQFYERDEEMVETVGAYLSSGLRAGDVVLVVATPAHMIAFERALMADGLSVAHARDNGSLITLDAGETLSQLMLGDGPDPGAFDSIVGGVIRHAARSGRPVRAYGEMVALLWDEGQVTAAIELETLWNELGLQVPFSLFCAYPTSSMVDRNDAFQQVCHLHSAVVGSSSSHNAEIDVTDEDLRAFTKALSAPRQARHFATETLTRWGRSELLADAAVVVTELATNAVVHADSDFTVALSLRPHEVRISVRDASDELPVLRDLAAADVSGRGVALVATLTTRWGIDLTDDGKVVWAEFVCEHPAAASLPAAAS